MRPKEAPPDYDLPVEFTVDENGVTVVEVILEVDPEGGPIAVARRLTNSIDWGSATRKAQVFNRLVHNESPSQGGRRNSLDATLGDARRVRGGKGRP